MAAFSIQYQEVQDHSFPLDSIFLPNTPINVTGFSGEPNTTTCFSQFCPQLSPIDGGIYENGVKADISNNETSVTNKNSTDSSSEEDYKHEIGEQVTQKVEKMEEKRKNRDGSSLSSTQSMDARELKRKRQKKSNGVIKDDKEKKTKAGKKDQKKVPQEVPTGYVHVRARRGQATDSHSLAERLRREKISERMKILQSLVPGCDKITGKALMLDEIINYVQSLQNQVEFLSMKLASLNPIFFDFGTNSDAFTLTLETERLNSLGSPVRNVENYNPAQPNVFSDTITIPDDYPPVDTSSSLLFDQQVQRPNILTQLLWDVDERRQKLINQSGFITNSLCSFH